MSVLGENSNSILDDSLNKIDVSTVEAGLLRGTLASGISAHFFGDFTLLLGPKVSCLFTFLFVDKMTWNARSNQKKSQQSAYGTYACSSTLVKWSFIE